MINIKKLAINFICDWFHKGGVITRDSQGRINWQCNTCGRWSDNPVPIDHENKLIDLHIEESIKK